ncbi:hypothetical protein J4444_00495 [Candidatus Woesearchaeota archaeon]|nr:hypothetical protein [Candidatus Woesearchaeota archaeon]
MPTLIACLSTGKGTWSEVTKIMNSQPWDKVFLITNSFGRDNFTSPDPKVSLIVVDTFAEPVALTEQILKELKGKITDFEVGINMVSGSGKEHMALLEAVLESGLNFRLVTLNNGQVEVMGMKR